MFIDSAKIFVKAGSGGKGCESFYRDKYTRYPIRDGGDGGNGGNVIIEADRHTHTLLNFRYKKHFKAKSGKIGSSNKKKGAGGKDCVLKVPCGTQIFDLNSKLLLRDLKEHSQQVVVARGGRGGLGNSGGAKNQESQPGEVKNLLLELKLIADVGIIGFPNAGKSSLVSKISSAKTKVASYPFTTKSPHLGLIRFNDKTLTIADIPGLIEGAHKGKGLGDKFLRHIERTRVLIHLLDLSPFAEKDPYEAFRLLNNELSSYSPKLLEKPQVIAANKIDLPQAQEKLDMLRKGIKKKIFGISCNDGRGLVALVKKLFEML